MLLDAAQEQQVVWTLGALRRAGWSQSDHGMVLWYVKSGSEFVLHTVLSMI